MTYFGARLKYLRNQDGETQQQLANSLKIAKSTISMYENGQREPDFETLEAIADHYNVDIRTFFPGSELPAQNENPIALEIMDMLSDLSPENLALAKSIIASIKESR